VVFIGYAFRRFLDRLHLLRSRLRGPALRSLVSPFLPVETSSRNSRWVPFVSPQALCHKEEGLWEGPTPRCRPHHLRIIQEPPSLYLELLCGCGPPGVRRYRLSP
jgi:hypothetical protein